MKLDLLLPGSRFTNGTVTYPDSVTEVYTFKDSAGHVLMTLTLVYTDSTKACLSSWSKSSS